MIAGPAEKPTVNYTFIKQLQVHFGEAVYLSGSTPSLGTWNPAQAIRMECSNHKFWIASLPIPLDVEVQYKCFAAPYEIEETEYDYSQVKWMGGFNESVKIPAHIGFKFLQENSEELDVMSVNLKCEMNDSEENSCWDTAKSNFIFLLNQCCEMILQHFPDLIAVQLANPHQITHISEKMHQLYRCLGTPPDSKDTEINCVLVRKDKFVVQEEELLRIGEEKQQIIKSSSSNQKYFSCLVLQPVLKDSAWIMHINAHFGSKTASTLQPNLEHISAAIKQKLNHFAPKLKNVFVTGDFGIADTDPVFTALAIHTEQLESLRYQLPKSFSDFEQTYNCFRHRDSPSLKIMNCTPIVVDHIFVRLRDYVPLRLSVLRDRVVSDHYPILGSFKIYQQ